MTGSKPEYPLFKTLDDYINKHTYFVRDAVWGWVDDNMIFVISQNGPDVFTMDPWPQLVFLMASGKYTASELIYHVADSYREKIPAFLDGCIITELTKLTDRGLVKFTDRPTEPAKFALHPIPEGKC